MIGEADYRSITSAVRTPRFVAFIDENNPYWQTTVAALIRIFSQTWGGKYFLIVPTDGKRIKDKFWELLEAYSPDYLGAYSFTLADLEEANPADYRKTADNWRKGWNFSQNFDEWFETQKPLARLGTFEIDRALDEELKNRLAPIHHSDRAVRHWLVRNYTPNFPFTKVADINPHAHCAVRTLVLSKELADTDLKIMVLSQSGDLNQAALDEYKSQGVAATTLPDQYRTEKLVEAVMFGAVDPVDLISAQALAGQPSGTASPSWSPQEDFVRHMPFQASMLHLARYYPLATHRDWEEPTTVVVGDSIDDFCLYFCLSRLHDGVLWLPKKSIDAYEMRRVNNLRLHRRGRPTRDYPEHARVAGAVVQLLYKSIGYGHDKRQIELRSMSLGADDLRRTLRVMDRIHWGAPGELSRHATVRPLPDTSTQCVARVIEENNFVNEQEMVFIDAKSVGHVSTPKPKNFSLIDPTHHRWMTSVQISGYVPPVLQFLGGQVALAHDSRIAKDGIAYFCPGVAYFGGDIDVALARPQLVMLSAQEIMRQYFAEAGLEIKSSDKGNYLTDTIDCFGGLEAAAKFIAQRTTRGVLDLFLAKRSADDGHVVYLQVEGRAFINYDGARKCVSDDASQIIDVLVGKDILRRGLISLCVRCRLSSWYDLAGLTTEFICGRCGLRQQFTKENWKRPDEPRWYYALAETVYQCYTHNSYLTILALDHLRQQSKVSFEYLPETDVINFPAEGEKHEIDVACLVDGRIVLDECKTEALRPSHTNKYQALAKMLPRLPDDMVFATSLQQVSAVFREKVAGIANGAILTGQELMV